MFLQLCLRATGNRCVTLVFHTLLTVLASETSAEHTDMAACIYKHFRMSHQKAEVEYLSFLHGNDLSGGGSE